MPLDSQRRTLLLALLGATIPGSATATNFLLCPKDPAISDLASPLTIDTHAHFFNGSDLQVREFLSQTTVGPGSELYSIVNAMSGMLQSLAWHAAPTAQEEQKVIKEYAGLLKECDGSEQLRRITKASFQNGYRIGRRELLLASRSLKQSFSGRSVLSASSGTSELDAAIASLPESFGEFEAQNDKGSGVLKSNPGVAGYLSFILHHFNYRHINAIDYLTTYSTGSPRKIDLAVANMVDYDYWLTMGRPTQTSLADQVDTMAQISILLSGRVHGFVSFCPFRETMTLDANGAGDGMRLVRKAIEQSGFIGVKLYPPMGFAPWGNTGRSDWSGKNSLLPVVNNPDFGRRLDAAMQSLFEYCLKNDVPVMAHTNHSNGPYKEFKAFAGSAYWAKALARFPGLRVSFGHFGDTDLEDHNGAQTLPFLQLMSREANSAGGNVFADSGYFTGALVSQDNMRNALKMLYAKENGIMLERFMYGSDWSMILKEKNVNRYLSDFIKVMASIDKPENGLVARNSNLTNAFFGGNAVEFLGLSKGNQNRARLESFYARNDVPTPDWMSKVDRS